MLFQVSNVCVTRKRKLSGTCAILSDPKKERQSLKGTSAGSKHAIKRKNVVTHAVDVCESQLERGAFRFHPVDSEWQNEACRRVGANYQRPFRFGHGGPDCPLTNPNFKTVRRVFSDGNCLFRSFSMIITGSQEGHLAVRIAILRHMQSIAHLLLGVHVTQNSIAEYVQDTHMDMDGAWGTEVETLTLAHLLQTNIYV